MFCRRLVFLYMTMSSFFLFGFISFLTCTFLPVFYRKVGKEEGNSVAAEYDCSFYETTAAEDYEYVEEVFHGVIQELQREKDRTLPLQPLYISEDKTNSLLLTPGSTGHFSLLRSRSPKPPLSPEKKEDKVTQRKTTPSFRLFNKSFKIFN